MEFRNKLQERDVDSIKEILESTGFFYDYEVDIAQELAQENLEKGEDASGYIFIIVEIENKPVAFASKSLTDVEQQYANIERELLAVQFGCTRFHNNLYGKLGRSEHKPLEMIVLKNLATAPPRLQCMLLRLQIYAISISFKPG